MSTPQRKRMELRAAIASLLVLAGCGGIEGTGSPQAGVEGTGLVDVNGVLMSVDTASVSGAQRSASRNESDTSLYGPVDSIDPDGRQISVLGQTVLLDDATQINGEVAEDLQKGQVCLVSGHASGGVWLATVLDCRGGYVPGSTLVEVEGTLEALDDRGFTLGTLLIDSSAASIDTAAGPLIEGAWVEVMGTQQQPGGTLKAEYIRVKR